MDYAPLYFYTGFILIYSLGEWFVMLMNKSFKKWKDPSVSVFSLLIKAVIIFPPLEFIFLERELPYWASITGGVLFVLAFLLRIKGLSDLKRSFSPNIEAVDKDALVDHGIYRHIRHPLYLAIICLAFACPVFLFSYFSCVVSCITLFYIMVRIHKEEKHLCENMAGYSDYVNRTKALFPNIY